MRKSILLILLILPFFVYAKEEVILNKCIDGDTFKIEKNGLTKSVRMLAIDTPEYSITVVEEPYGKEASIYTCNLLTNAKKIELEYDPNSDELDKYQRILAWVFVDDVLLQEKIVRNGYGEVAYLYDDYKYTKILQENEVLAKKDKLNMWSDNDFEKDNWINIFIGFGVALIAYLLNIVIIKLKRKIKKSRIYVKLS